MHTHPVYEYIDFAKPEQQHIPKQSDTHTPTHTSSQPPDEKIQQWLSILVRKRWRAAVQAVKFSSACFRFIRIKRMATTMGFVTTAVAKWKKIRTVVVRRVRVYTVYCSACVRCPAVFRGGTDRVWGGNDPYSCLFCAIGFSKVPGKHHSVTLISQNWQHKLYRMTLLAAFLQRKLKIARRAVIVKKWLATGVWRTYLMKRFLRDKVREDARL